MTATKWEATGQLMNGPANARSSATPGVTGLRGRNSPRAGSGKTKCSERWHPVPLVSFTEDPERSPVKHSSPFSPNIPALVFSPWRRWKVNGVCVPNVLADLVVEDAGLFSGLLRRSFASADGRDA